MNAMGARIRGGALVRATLAALLAASVAACGTTAGRAKTDVPSSMLYIPDFFKTAQDGELPDAARTAVREDNQAPKRG